MKLSVKLMNSIQVNYTTLKMYVRANWDNNSNYDDE